MGLEVQKNSVLDVEFMKLGGSGTNEGNSQINDNGWHQTSLEIRSLSFGKIEDSIIEGNLGQAINVKHQSILNLENVTIQNNGIGSSSSNQFEGINISNKSNVY